MKMLAGIKNHRIIIVICAFTLLIIAGGLSSKLLIERTTGNMEPEKQAGIYENRETGGLGGEDQLKTGTAQTITENAKLPETQGAKDYSALTPVADLPAFQNRIVKTASVTLKIKKGRFDSAYEQVVMAAQANGGYVAGSNSISADDRLVSGTLSIKVPTENFEIILSKLRRFGKISALNIDSQDVSTEFVDLEGRLRNWRAQESLLISLMDKAQNVSESISVQQQLSQVQMEIEQIAGRLNYLKNQTSFSSVQITITEPGTPLQQADPWGFRSAVKQSAHAFVNTINGLIVLIGYLFPLALVGGLSVLAWLGVRRRTMAAA